MPPPSSAAIAADIPPSPNLGRTIRRKPTFTCDTAWLERSEGNGSRRLVQKVHDWDETANGGMGDWELVDERRFSYDRLGRADWRETRQTEPAAGSAAQR